jgi:hypothetical protein
VTQGAGLDLVEDLIARADREVEGIKASLSEAQTLRKFLAGLHERLNAGQLSEALRHIRAGSKALAALEGRDVEAHTAVENLAAELQVQVEGASKELVIRFPEAVAATSLNLDPGSRHPKYTLLDGLIQVQFEKASLTTQITPRDGRRALLGTDVPVVVARLKEEAERLTMRPFNPKTVLAQITVAYQAVCMEAGIPVGESIPIKGVISELAKAKGFRPDEFNVDLSRLVRDEYSVNRLKLENSRDANSGVLLWQLDQRGYYGYIKIEGD